MTDEQREFFRRHGYVVLSDALGADEVALFAELYDRDRRDHPAVWGQFGQQWVNCDALITSPRMDEVIRHPKVMAAAEALMGGPLAFGEICIRHMDPYSGEPQQGWHRDKPHWLGHALRMDYIQLMLYLSDVDESTHCFSLSPEGADEPILDKAMQLERGGISDLHGPAGTVALFNVSVLHTATVRRTTAERRTIQVYYGHGDRPYLSNCTVVPERLWRDHEDAAVRAFYGKLNRKTRRYVQARDAGELGDQDLVLRWCKRYDLELKQANNHARSESGDDDGPAAGGMEHGDMGE